MRVGEHAGKEKGQAMRALGFALAVAVAATGFAARAQGPESRFNQVELQAEAAREVQNDLMTANLYAEASGPSAVRVADQLNRVSAQALKAAAAQKALKARASFSQT